MYVSANDEFEMYLNGKLVEKGESRGQQRVLDVSEYMEPGVNLIAVRVRQVSENAPMLALKFRTKEKNETRWRSLTTDNTWKSRQREVKNWYHNSLNDIGWLSANQMAEINFNRPAQRTAVTATQSSQPQAPQTAIAQPPTSTGSTTKTVETPQTPQMASRLLETTNSNLDLPRPLMVDSTIGLSSNGSSSNGSSSNGSSSNGSSAKGSTTAGSTAILAEESTAAREPIQLQSPIDIDALKASASTVNTPRKDPFADEMSTDTEPELGGDDPSFATQVSSSQDESSETHMSAPIDSSVSGENFADNRGDLTLMSPDQTSEGANMQNAGRFNVDPEFTIQQVMLDEESGSVLAMAFNEFGKLILSKEGGPLYITDLTIPYDEKNTRTRVLCSQVNSCQGILPLNGDVFVTGHGPDGQALYRLSDPNRDGQLEVSETVLKFRGQLGEHGAHGIELGPDGMIYVALGNATGLEIKADSNSPYQFTYEGDLIERYEDPGGHAAGFKAPGGTIVRVSLDGSKVQTVCGGIRNAYDLVFNSQGELFIHDSDMESNIGHSWYRPTRIYHVADGAEFGWRSGWSKFPEYFADVIEPAATTGRGSPTGAVLYQHMQFPSRYHNTMFMADWSEGRILVVREDSSGAGYKAQPEVFVSGKPLNVTDLAIGEDGTLYFGTGGRGTTGGIYRVVWKGTIPEHMLSFENDLERVIRHPQPQSAWARQNTALIKNKLRGQWKKALIGVAKESKNDPQYRVRALDTMVFYGPFPSKELISELARDPSALVRSKAAKLIGLKNRPELTETLYGLLADEDVQVRRHAAESCIRTGVQPTVSSMFQMLSSSDKAEALPARRLLERTPVGQWRQDVMEAQNIRVFINGAMALMTAHPSIENAYDVLARTSDSMDGFVSDTDFVDLLRVIQLTVSQAKVDAKQIPAFVQKLANEFPSGNGIINRQLSMILANLKPVSFEGRIKDYFDNHQDSDEDKLHVAMQLQKIGDSLEADSFTSLIDTLETARTRLGGTAYRSYISRAITELSQTADEEQVQAILENGSQWPNALVTSFFRLPEKLSAEQIDLVISADRELAEPETEDLTIRRMRLGVIAMLAQSGTDESFEYLREIWREREKYRNEIALGMAQKPEGENWAYLISTVPVLDDLTGIDVLAALTKVRRRPSQPDPYRNVIELGYRLRREGARQASELLTHWTKEEPRNSVTSSVSWKQSMDFWSDWFEQNWEELEPITRNESTRFGKFDSAQVLAYLEQNNVGNPKHGGEIFTKAQCASCHRIGSVGASIGPDLTNLTNRFSTREILESIVHPANVISDQYRSKKILTLDGQQFEGMVVRDGPESIVVLDNKGSTTRLNLDDIEEVKETTTSAMPEGLLNNLTMDEIASLFSFMKGDSGIRSAEASSATPDSETEAKR